MNFSRRFRNRFLQQENIIATGNSIVSTEAIQLLKQRFGVNKVDAITHKSFVNAKTANGCAL